MIGSQFYLTVCGVPSLPCVEAEKSFNGFFLQMNKFPNYTFKKFHCPLNKVSLHYQTVIDQRLRVIHQPFSWTSVGPSKCPIDKIIASQGYLTVLGVTWLPCVPAENSFTEMLLHMNNFQIRHCKKFHCFLK